MAVAHQLIAPTGAQQRRRARMRTHMHAHARTRIGLVSLPSDRLERLGPTRAQLTLSMLLVESERCLTALSVCSELSSFSMGGI